MFTAVCRLEAHITWNNPASRAPASSGHERPRIVTDGRGNPLAGFTKFNSAFAQSRRAVARSSDFGNSFEPDIKVSGRSSETAPVRNGCPGTLARFRGYTAIKVICVI